MAAAPSTLQIQGPMQTAIGTVVVNQSIAIAVPLGGITLVTLASGFNTIAVPTGATVVIITFAPNNAVGVTLKGITGDTGLVLNKTGVNELQLDATQTTIGITASSIHTTQTTIQFF